MKKKEVWLLMEQLRQVFDVVRLVDVSLTRQCGIDSEGRVVAEPYACYAVWNKGRRCENCISARAFARRSTMAVSYTHLDVYKRQPHASPKSECRGGCLPQPSVQPGAGPEARGAWGAPLQHGRCV